MMNNKHILNGLAAVSMAAAGIVAATPALASGEKWDIPTEADYTDAIKSALKVYEADSDADFVQEVRFAWMEQFQIASVQPNGSNGLHLKQGGSPFNQEFRRSWVGVNVKFNTGTLFHTWARIGGLPMRDTFSNGRQKKGYSYTDLFDLYIKQDIPGVKGLSVKGGKIKPLFTMDYTESSAKIKCIERSFLGNFHNFDSNWGIDVTYKPNKEWTFYGQLLANDRAHNAKSMTHGDVYRDGRGLKGEFGWEDKCFGILGTRYQFGVTETTSHTLSLQYAHDFNNAYHGRREPGNNCYGLGVKDAVSIGYIYEYDRLSILTDLVANFETMEGQGSNNIGIQIQPVYAISPHVDLVFRYTGMTGDGACRLGADRYICTNTTASSWVDSINAFYIGANYYFSARNPDALKLMFGAEYVTSRKNGADHYNGWEFSSAIRWNF